MNRVNEKLLKKYSSTGPRYTSYPPATFFDTKFTNEQYQEKLIESNKESPENISVYIHIPFCPIMLFFFQDNIVFVGTVNLIRISQFLPSMQNCIPLIIVSLP